MDTLAFSHIKLAFFLHLKILMFSFTCVMLSAWSHPTKSWELCVCNRGHVYFLLFHVWVCSLVTQLGAKPPCHDRVFEGHVRLHRRGPYRCRPLLYRRTFFSLHPCPHHCSPAPMQTPIKCFRRGMSCSVSSNVHSSLTYRASAALNKVDTTLRQL